MKIIKKTTENKVDIVRAMNTTKSLPLKIVENTSKGGRTFYSLDLEY